MQEVVNLNPQWIKVIGADGHTEHISWCVMLCAMAITRPRRRSTQYDTLRLALDMPAPGYVIHESAVWSEYHHRCASRGNHVCYLIVMVQVVLSSTPRKPLPLRRQGGPKARRQSPAEV